jgi:UDP-N-acetylmuramyl pentapeptide synthase
MRVEPALVAAVGAFVPAFEPHRAALGDRLLTAADPASLGKLLGPRLKGDEFVLMKASRGVQLERAIPFLMPDGD